MNNFKILVVEDEQILALDIRNSLQRLGYAVPEITGSGEEALKKIAESHPHLVLMNICLQGEKNDMQAADIIRKTFGIPVLYLTDYSDDTTLHRMRLTEPYNYLLKPFTERDLHIAIQMTLYKHELESKSQQEKHRLTAILNSIGSAVIVTDANGCIQMMNPLAEVLTAWKQDEAFAKDLAIILNLVDKDCGENVENLATQAMQADAVMNLPEKYTLIAKDNTEKQIGGSISSVRDGNGEISGTVLVFQDITKRKEMEALLLRNAFYDGLTALPNRILFLDRLRQAIERSKRRNDYLFAVLFLDLDGFKGINDRFGHGMGDDLLVAIARQLELCLRSGDTIARFGGDEFAVLLEEIKDVTDATNVAKRIEESLIFPLHLQGHEILATASIGIALSGSDYDEPETLLRDADTAMYRAKQLGKARYAIFA